MATSHYIYTKLPLRELESVVQNFQKEFDLLIEDSFSEEELIHFEKMIDAIAAIYVQPILSDLSFDDFYADENEMEAQRAFFDQCQSSIGLENLPYFESNPFQVTYQQQLLENFSEVLIDRGGVNELNFKQRYLDDLKRYKNLESLLSQQVEKVIAVNTIKPVDPIDFVILDVYRELERLAWKEIDAQELSPKVQKILHVMKIEKLNADQLLRKVGLNPKEFDDGLERLKFWLRKI